MRRIDMRKTLSLALALHLSVLFACGMAWGAATQAAKPKPKQAAAPVPTKEAILEIVAASIKPIEPNLSDQDRKAVEDVRTTVADYNFSKELFGDSLNNLISALTLKLASAKSFDGLTVASAAIVEKLPKNWRALNLFASVLHTRDSFRDAVAVLRYALTMENQNKNVLIQLNLANVYLDFNQDEKAKVLLDKLEVDDAGNKAVYRALATYYYKKQDWGHFREYLGKAAKFKGFKKKKTEKKKEEVEQKEVKESESTDEMEAKLKPLGETIPLTTADIIEEDYPDAAQKIRNKYCKLVPAERWILPNLPQVNLNGPPDFKRNAPIVGAWHKIMADKLSSFTKRQAGQAGFDLKASKQAQRQQAKAAAQAKTAEAMQGAMDAIKLLENMPGMSKAQISKTKERMQQAANKMNVKVQDQPVDMNAPPPGSDSGSLFAAENYYNYKRIQAAYGVYFMKYYRELIAQFADILKVYGEKVKEEDDSFKVEWEKLRKEHDEQTQSGNGGSHSGIDEPCRRAQIGHKQRLNVISDDYYRQWSNLYLPQYVKKMKPNLDAYFNVCMLHVRNMNDPKIMEQEYSTTIMTHSTWSVQAMGYIEWGGRFSYHPEAEEEERKLNQEIAKAKDEAKAKENEFKQEFNPPESGWTDWINDHFVVEISGEILALKVSPKSIEFEAFVPVFGPVGPGGGVKYDFSEQKFETYTAVGAKWKTGVNICGIEAKIEAAGDFRRTATWDLSNGKYNETDGAKGEGKATLGKVSAGAEVQLDTQLNAKITGKVSFDDHATIQAEQEMNLGK
jgi:hypothetical protein